MKNPLRRAEIPSIPWLALVRIAIGLLFAISGFGKLAQPRANFIAAIENYSFLNEWGIEAASVIVPWAELLGGAFLALGLWQRAALVVIWLLNSAFIGVIAQALVRKLTIDKCGCLGELLSIPPQVMLGVDALLWLACAFLWVKADEGAALSLDRQFERGKA